MPIYIYKGNKQISTNAIRNDKAVKAIYAKEQGKETVCVWGSDDIMIFTYTVTNNKITITGLKSDKQPTSLIIPTQIEGLIVTTIAPNAFKNKNKIKKVVVPNSVTSIGYTAFWGCTELTSVTIPNSVTSIGGSAFEACTGLTSIVISDSVTSIGNAVFRDCTGLTRITFNGTKAQWNAIYKGSGWNSNTGNYTIHCTDGNIPKQ